MGFQMNKQRARHMGGDGGAQNQGQGPKHPDIHIKSHSSGHTVHIMHQDGRHETHEHDTGDAEGIAAHIHEHIGNGEDHGSDGGQLQGEDLGALGS